MAKIRDPRFECMDREELRKLQGERLVSTVKHEYENVALYRQRMDEKGIKPEDIRGLDDLRYLPFMEKTDLRDTFPYGLFAVPTKDIVRIQGSSGTTGKPIVSGYTAGDIDIWTEMMARTMTAEGVDENSVVQVCYGYGLFTGGLGAHQGATKLGALTIPMSSGNTQRQIMMMHDLGVTHLCCTPSYALYLGESIREAGIDPKEMKLKNGSFGAEPWTEEMRVRIEELLGINAYDIYGLTEIAGPGVSYECEAKRGMHVNEDHVIPEIINPITGEQLPYGEKGELVFTTITKRGMPMLRYRTHDICRLHDEKCDCGRTFVRMERLMGRTDDMLIIRGVNVFPSQIEGILAGTQDVMPHYMLIVDRVNSQDTLEVQVEVTDAIFTDSLGRLEATKRYIGEQIKSVVGIKATVNLVAPHTMPRSEGKAKHIIDRRKL
ncbi:MAG: phenylacetate--CoA ligase [Clostridia bacterium]|nr:phenylacetate--CoA ligase [Clostridia bacterium]